MLLSKFLPSLQKVHFREPTRFFVIHERKKPPSFTVNLTDGFLSRGDRVCWPGKDTNPLEICHLWIHHSVNIQMSKLERRLAFECQHLPPAAPWGMPVKEVAYLFSKLKCTSRVGLKSFSDKNCDTRNWLLLPLNMSGTLGSCLNFSRTQFSQFQPQKIILVCLQYCFNSH